MITRGDFSIMIWILMIQTLALTAGQPWAFFRWAGFYFVATAGMLFIKRGNR